MIDAPYQAAFARLGLSSHEAIEDYFLGADRPEGTRVVVKQAQLVLPNGSELPVFFKQYHYRKPSWGFWGRKSKALCEYENYEVFGALGIAAAERVGCGEQRDSLGRLSRAFIITRAVSEAKTLTDFLRDHCPDRSSSGARELRDSILAQLASMTRRMHGAKFFHYDLVWRNILVTWQSPDEPKVWWIDCPRGKFDTWSPLQRRRLVRDLALLNRVAVQWCLSRERLNFIKRYLGVTRSDAAARRLIHETMTYHRRRWPSDFEKIQARPTSEGLDKRTN